MKVRVTYTYSSRYTEVLNVTQEVIDAAGGLDNWDPSELLEPDSMSDDGYGDLDIDTVEELPHA